MVYIRMRRYLQEYVPDLYVDRWVTQVPNGKSVPQRCMEKYGEVLRLYCTTSGA
mgnify:CR=1 FL=1